MWEANVINLPFGNDNYHPYVVFSGMVCDWVYHITEIVEEHNTL